MRALRLATLASCLVLGAIGQTVSFDAASVKAHDPLQPHGRPRLGNGTMTIVGSAVHDLVLLAYDLQGYQLVAPEDWMKSESFDIQAKSEKRDASAPELKLMLQTLLKERFGLQIHHESRTIAAYVLEAGKNGAQLKAGEPRSAAALQIDGPHLFARGATMPLFASWVGNNLQRPVVDQTGIAGAYDFDLDFDEEGATMGSMNQAIRGLGLRLEAKPKVTIDAVVIDHAERPSAN